LVTICSTASRHRLRSITLISLLPTDGYVDCSTYHDFGSYHVLVLLESFCCLHYGLCSVTFTFLSFAPITAGLFTYKGYRGPLPHAVAYRIPPFGICLFGTFVDLILTHSPFVLFDYTIVLISDYIPRHPTAHCVYRVSPFRYILFTIPTPPCHLPHCCCY